MNSNFQKSRSVDFQSFRSLLESEPYSDADTTMRSQLLEYICRGIEPTHPCLRGILRNDLSQTLGTRPVGESGIRTIEMLLAFLYDHAPGPCFGDAELLEIWSDNLFALHLIEMPASTDYRIELPPALRHNFPWSRVDELIAEEVTL